MESDKRFKYPGVIFSFRFHTHLYKERGQPDRKGDVTIMKYWHGKNGRAYGKSLKMATSEAVMTMLAALRCFKSHPSSECTIR